MKKNYEKPMIMIENFELDQHIASGCVLIVEELQGGGATIDPNKNPTIGGLDPIAGQNVFNSNMKGCDVELNQYCYHNSVVGIGTHTSL